MPNDLKNLEAILDKCVIKGEAIVFKYKGINLKVVIADE